MKLSFGDFSQQSLFFLYTPLKEQLRSDICITQQNLNKVKRPFFQPLFLKDEIHYDRIAKSLCKKKFVWYLVSFLVCEWYVISNQHKS